MKTETGWWKWPQRVCGVQRSFPIPVLPVRLHRYFRRRFIVSALVSFMTGIFGCNGGGTSTETVGVVGTVVSPDNRTVAGVPVVLMDTILGDINGSRNTIVDTTDEYGRFTLRIEYLGSYLLAVKDTNGRVFMEEVDIADYDTSLGMLTVNTPGSLNGCIFDDSMTFTANPRVILYKKDIPFKYQWARGAFTIDSLAPGEVRVQIGVWIDDYSRANKWIVFFDSTVFISPGAATAIDTVFINDAALQKTEDAAIAAFDPVPSPGTGSAVH